MVPSYQLFSVFSFPLTPLIVLHRNCLQFTRRVLDLSMNANILFPVANNEFFCRSILNSSNTMSILSLELATVFSSTEVIDIEYFLENIESLHVAWQWNLIVTLLHKVHKKILVYRTGIHSLLNVLFCLLLRFFDVRVLG